MTLLYHESQIAALCGVHCLNTLLQGPYVSEIDLAQIAHEFDAMEQAVMREGGVTSEDYLRYMAEGSGNVAADGMFSSQVLGKSLSVWNLSIFPLDNPEVRAAAKDPQLEHSFICNLQEHWFTIRKVENDWWNFNSLFPAPQPLSQFYLSAFLGSLKEQGYTIFVVRGTLPPAGTRQTDGPGKWFTPQQAKQANDAAADARQRGKMTNVLETAFSRAAQQGGKLQLRSKRAADAASNEGAYGDDEDQDLAAAIEASLAQTGGGGASSSSAGAAGRGSSRAPAAPATQRGSPGPGGAQGSPSARGAAGGTGSGTRGGSGGVDPDMMEEDDPELAAAIAASLAEASTTAPAAVSSPAAAPRAPEPEPPAGPGVIELAFRLPGGARAARRFVDSSPLSSLYDYLGHEHGLRSHAITTQFPRKELASSSITLAEAKVAAREVLNVEVKR